MDELMRSIEKARVDAKLREELRDILTDVQDYGKYALDSYKALRDQEKETVKDHLRYSKELVRLYTFLDDNGISMKDLDIELPNLFGV